MATCVSIAWGCKDTLLLKKEGGWVLLIISATEIQDPKPLQTPSLLGAYKADCSSHVVLATPQVRCCYYLHLQARKQRPREAIEVALDQAASRRKTQTQTC